MAKKENLMPPHPLYPPPNPTSQNQLSANPPSHNLNPKLTASPPSQLISSPPLGPVKITLMESSSAPIFTAPTMTESIQSSSVAATPTKILACKGSWSEIV